eukprot:1654879-Rhodomonas_salina.3
MHVYGRVRRRAAANRTGLLFWVGPPFLLAVFACRADVCGVFMLSCWSALSRLPAMARLRSQVSAYAQAVRTVVLS